MRGEDPGDACATDLAAGKFVGKALQCRGVQIDGLEHGLDTRLTLLRVLHP